MKKKLRKIVVHGQTYLWSFTQGYKATGNQANPWQCHDHFTAYLLHTKASPLHITFLTWEDPVIGGPLRTGLPLDLAKEYTGSPGLNLSTPQGAAWIIQRALEAGWQPQRSRGALLIEQGVEWLKHQQKLK